MLRCLLFWYVVSVAALGQTNGRDLSFVSCWIGNDAQPRPQTRSVTSDTVESPDHWRAYATVTAEAVNGSCKNTTRLFVASAGRGFSRIYTQSRIQTQDGNGIRLLGWSAKGNRLLAETDSWAYGSDAPPVRAMLIYEPGHRVETRHIYNSLKQRLGPKCLFDYSLLGWSSESSIILNVLPFREDPAIDDRPSCISQPASFLYNVHTGEIRPQ